MLWWQSVKGCPEFGGIKVTQDKLAAKAYGLHLIQGAPRCYRIVTAPAGIVGWFGNSGGYALNVAVQCRPSVIKLVGFDYSAKRGLHWHGPHGTGLNNPRPSTLEKWRAVLDEQAGLIASLGIEVVNCSPESALRNYQKGSLT